MRKRLFGLAAAATILFAACGGTVTSPSAAPSTAPSTPPASTAPSSTEPSASTGFTEDVLLKPAPYTPEACAKQGGNIVVADWQAYSNLNPLLTSAFKNFQVMGPTMYALWTISPDGKWMPQMATKVPRLSDGSIVMDSSGTGFTVNLDMKPGLLWSDGEPLTLNDLKYTWQWVMDPANTGLPSGTIGWESIDKFDVAADGLTAAVHFKEGYAGYYGLLGTQFLPEHYMKTIPVADAVKKSYPIGTPDLAKAPTSGPFKYGASSADQVVLEKNPNFKADHVACLDTITFKFYTDAKDAMEAAFLNKEVDLATDLLQGDYAAIQPVDPAFGRADIGPAWEYEHLDLQQLNAAFKDPKVRQAVAAGIDKDKLWDTVYPGVPKPVTACAPTPPGLYWRAEGLKCQEYDAAAAKQLLADAGYKDTNGDGIVEKDGKELVLQHCSTPAPFRTAGGDTIAAMLKEVGIKVVPTYDPILFEAWGDTTKETKCNIYRGTYDTAEFAYVFTLDLFGDYYYSYDSSQIPTEANKGNGGNTIRVDDPEMDAALAELKSTVDPAKQFEIAQKIQEIYARSNFEVPLYYRSAVRGVSNQLGNYFKNPSTASDMWNTQDWFIKG